jgi:predicted dehydrogenase
MSAKKLKVGIAGYGVVGKRRRVFIDQNPHLTTVAVSDITFGKQVVAKDGISCLPDFTSLLEQDLDVLFVSLPNYLAAKATMAGLKRGLHVFCEKPPGRTVEDVRNVMAVEKRHPHLKLKYGFNHRYHDSIAEAKRIIESGRYGKIINIRGIYGKSSMIPFTGNWRSERKYAGGGILLDQGIHMLDMIRYFAGDFDEIKSFVSNDYWRHDVEDNAYAIMRSKSGCVAMLHSTATQWQHRFRLEVTLKDALIELTGILSGTKSYGGEQLELVLRKEGSHVGSFTKTSKAYLEDNSWRDEVNEFSDLIVKNKKVVQGTSLDALKVMELVYKIYCADGKWQESFNINHP